MNKTEKCFWIILLTAVLMLSVFTVKSTRAAIGIEVTGEAELKDGGSKHFEGKQSGGHFERFFKLTVPSDGKVEITIKASIEDTKYQLLAEDLTSITYADGVFKNELPYAQAKFSWVLSKGTYYLQYFSDYDWVQEGEYEIDLTYTDYLKDAVVTDELAVSMDNPQQLMLGQEVTAVATLTDTADWFVYTPSTDWDYQLKVKNYCSAKDIYVYEESEDNYVKTISSYADSDHETNPQDETLDLQLTAGKKYYILEDSGYGKCLFTLVPVRPLRTESVTAALYGYNDVQLTWTAAEGADGYRIYYKKAGNQKYTYLKTVWTETCKVANLDDASKYTFAVYTLKKIDDVWYRSDKGKTASIYTLGKMAAPVTEKIEDGKVSVSYQKMTGASGYQISRNTKEAGVGSVGVSKTTEKVLKQAEGTTMYYRVRAYRTVNGARVYGPWSNAAVYRQK